MFKEYLLNFPEMFSKATKNEFLKSCQGFIELEIMIVLAASFQQSLAKMLANAY